jgi:uncharacterized caspase-like protein
MTQIPLSSATGGAEPFRRLGGRDNLSPFAREEFIMTSIASRFAACLLGLVPTALLPFAACAEKRVALVIGNANYQLAERLVNPANDAQAMATLFKVAGFDQVELNLDLDAREFKRVLGAFGNTAAGADIIVVYYAGHGIQVDRKNRIVPVDASLNDDVDDETISLERLTEIAAGAKKLGLIILDACRPLANNKKRNRSHRRDIAPGIAQVHPTGNTLIAYATTACTEVQGGTDNHSPYTKALLKHLTKPWLDIRLALRRVRDEVREKTLSKLEPDFYGTLPEYSIALVSSEHPNPR